MREHLRLAAMVGACALLAASPALAVDIENRDRKDAEVVINRADGSSETITLKGGQKLTDICSDCAILLGDSAVEARGREVVAVQGGKVEIKGKR